MVTLDLEKSQKLLEVSLKTDFNSNVTSMASVGSSIWLKYLHITETKNDLNHP